MTDLAGATRNPPLDANTSHAHWCEPCRRKFRAPRRPEPPTTYEEWRARTLLRLETSGGPR